MEWYGDPLDFRPKKPHPLPQYVSPKEIDVLIEAITSKKNHKSTIERDVLLIKFITLSGLRRQELGLLEVQDILLEKCIVIVKNAKGGQQRTVPLPP